MPIADNKKLQEAWKAMRKSLGAENVAITDWTLPI